MTQSTVQELESAEKTKSYKTHNRSDTLWVLHLFGTAVGAGILYLPINAGVQGVWPLIIVTLLAGPMVYYAHQSLARVVLASTRLNANITDAVSEHFGKRIGFFITLMYFLAYFPVLLIYGVGITNTVESLLINQLHITSIDRTWLSLVLIGGMMLVMNCGEKTMLKFTEYLVYPLVALLFVLSIYLVPHWQLEAFTYVPSPQDWLTTIWLTIPVIIFSFNHSPAISSFAQAQRRQHGDHAHPHVNRILRRTATALLLFVMLFVFSCVLTLSPEQLAEARAQNISVLSYLANQFDNPVYAYLGPLIAFVAIISSFFGHYLGAREGLEGLITKAAARYQHKPQAKTLKYFSMVFFFMTTWYFSIKNPSVLTMIESFVGPIIAAILFILPMVAIHRVAALAKFKGTKRNVFVTVTGLITLSAIFYQLF